MNGLFLFAADLDGTLLPNTGKRPASGCIERTRALLERLQGADCLVAYVSGRHLSLARLGHRAFRLPPPDYWVCNVGTEIYERRGGPVEDWASSLGPPFDLSVLLGALRAIPHVSAQEGARQGPRKASLYYPRPASPALCTRVLELARSRRPDVRLVHSVEEKTGRALLDIIPAAAGKASALRYLAERHCIPAERVFFAGDSSNDLDALVSGVCGTLVGNAADPVRDEARHLKQATPGARVYMAEKFYGDGVLEGLAAYGFSASS